MKPETKEAVIQELASADTCLQSRPGTGPAMLHIRKAIRLLQAEDAPEGGRNG